MTPRDTLLSALASDPGDEAAWLALADCLEESGQDPAAELTRLREWLRHADIEDPRRPHQEARFQTLITSGARPVVPRKTLALANNVSMTFLLIPPGSFVMGSPDDEVDRYSDEGPRHRVTLTRGFWFGLTPVTQAQWEAIMTTNPSRFTAPDQPIESVSWHECRTFCRLLSERLGGTFRLPSEAEWEYACRAGTTSRFHGGLDEAALDRVGWYHHNTEYGTKPVGRKEPNGWGLFDVHGNVREWCLDGEYDYHSEDQVDPLHEQANGERQMRGGSWYNSPEMCRAAFRFSVEANGRGYGYGCRVLLEWRPGR